MMLRFFFFFNDTATTEIYTLSLHDALPICGRDRVERGDEPAPVNVGGSLENEHDAAGAIDGLSRPARRDDKRSEEHTSELQSLAYLVCRLLLEKKKKPNRSTPTRAQTHTPH